MINYIVSLQRVQLNLQIYVAPVLIIILLVSFLLMDLLADTFSWSTCVDFHLTIYISFSMTLWSYICV